MLIWKAVRGRIRRARREVVGLITFPRGVVRLRLCVQLVVLGSEAPLGQERRHHLSGLLQGGVANLPGDLLADLLGSQSGHQFVDLLTHPLGLEVTNLLRAVHSHVLGLVATPGRAGHEVTVVRSAGLERNLLTDGVGQGPHHGLLHHPAGLLRALLDHLHDGLLPELGDAARLVLSLTNLTGRL